MQKKMYGAAKIYIKHKDLELSRNQRHEFQKVENFVIATLRMCLFPVENLSTWVRAFFWKTDFQDDGML